METITYSLTQDQRHSDQYYEDVAALTATVLAAAERRFGATVAAFIEHVRSTGHEEPRTTPEYQFELLLLGVFWRIYGAQAITQQQLSQRVLASLSQLRQRGGRIKKAADRVRGVLNTLLLSYNGQHPARTPAPTLAHLARLLAWMDAAGEFPQEVKRLRAWETFFHAQPAAAAHETLVACLDIAAWFEAQSLSTLGRYTHEVDSFLSDNLPHYRWREDRVFCGRQRVEYHLNMVGTTIMNHAFRADFLAADQKVVLVPPCMRAKPADECQAVDTPLGARCAACTPECRVHQATKLGEKHGFTVLMLPHELSVFSNNTAPQAALSRVGIVGVSCALTNVTGGWRTRELGIPAQGLLLDYVGCVWHWHPDGIPTSINFRELLRLLDERSAPHARQSAPESKLARTPSGPAS